MKYFVIKGSDEVNNLIVELISDVDLYTINQVINHGYYGSDLPENIYFKIVYTGYQENPDNDLLNMIFPFNSFTKYKYRDFTLLPLEKITHLPSDLGRWVDYTKNKLRYKLIYDIKLNDGAIIYNCYPNGNTFTCFSCSEQGLEKSEFLDNEIKEICLSNNRNTNSDIELNFKVFSYFILDKER